MACSPQRDVPRSELSELPPQSRLSKVLWAIPQAMVGGAFVWCGLDTLFGSTASIWDRFVMGPLMFVMAWVMALTVTTLISASIDLWRRLVATPAPQAGKDSEPGRESQGLAAPDRYVGKLLETSRSLRVDH